MISLAGRALKSLLRREPQQVIDAGHKKLLQDSGLFNPSWYLQRYPDVAKRSHDPLDHFILHGSLEGRWPNPLFDPEWYRDQNSDVSFSRIGPLEHYITIGADEKRDPHPLFSTSWYLKQNKQARESSLNPLAHYIINGAIDRTSPHPLFAVEWNDSKDWGAVHSNVNPLVRYLSLAREQLSEPHPLFDPVYYLENHGHLMEAEENPLLHYARRGGSELELSPHPLFSAAYYVAQRGGIGGRNPLAEYTAGEAENTASPHPLFDASWYLSKYPQARDYDRAPLIHYVCTGTVSGTEPNFLFDSKWYGDQNNAPSRGSWALRHFIKHADRDLSCHPCFDGSWYKALYPDVVREGVISALEHYLRHGETAGRSPHPLFHPDWCAKKVRGRSAVRSYLTGRWEKLGSPHPLFEQTWFERVSPPAPGDDRAPLHRYLGDSNLIGAGDPHPFFDGAYYISKYEDVARSAVNPFAHYVRFGIDEDRAPTPHFDPVWYRDQYTEQLGSLRPLEHFLDAGYSCGKSPSAAAQNLGSWDIVEPDVFNATRPLSAYLAIIGHDIRAVMTAEAIKATPEYDVWIGRLLGKLRSISIPKASTKPTVSVILPVYNSLHFTIAALIALFSSPDITTFEVIVVDDCSTDQTRSVLSTFEGIRYVRNKRNLGYLRSNNEAAKRARGEFLFLLNSDTMVCPGWLDESIRTMKENENVGLVGSKLIYPNGVLQEAGGILWNDGSAWNYGREGNASACEMNYARRVDYCSAAAVLISRRLWAELGGFDEHYLPAYGEDSDLALRIRQRGYDVMCAATSTVVHFEGMSHGTDLTQGVKAHQLVNAKKLRERWRPYLETLQENGQDLQIAKDRGVLRRVLFLDNCTPQPDEDAGSITVMNLMLLLKDAGFQVTFVPQDNYAYLGRYTRDLQRRGIEVLYAPDCNSVAAHLSACGERYDLIVMYRPDSHSRHIEAVKTYAPDAATIYHTCDLHFTRMERQAALTGDEAIAQAALKMKDVEFAAMQSTDLTIIHSEAEEKILGPQLKSVNFKIFNWAVPVESLDAAFEERKDLLFVGGYAHQPNVDAVIFFVSDVLPLILEQDPTIRVHLVGSRVPDSVKALAGPNVVVHGYVADIGPMMASARLSIAPLRYGAGVKGKIATALSVGLPTVTTTVGAEGMGLVDGRDVLVADQPLEMANKILRLYHDGDLWRKIARNGLEYAEAALGPTRARLVMDDILGDLGFKPIKQRGELRLVSPVSARLPRRRRSHVPALAPIERIEQIFALGENAAADPARRYDDLLKASHYGVSKWTFPGWSVPARSWVDFKIELPQRDYKLDGLHLLGSLKCPLTGLNSRERLLASQLEAMRLDLPPDFVAGIFESKRFCDWMKIAFPRARIVRPKRNGFARSSAAFDVLVGLGNSAIANQIKPLFQLAHEQLRPNGRLFLVPPATSDMSSSEFTAQCMLAAYGLRGSFEAPRVDRVHWPENAHLGEGLFRMTLRRSTSCDVQNSSTSSRPASA